MSQRKNGKFLKIYQKRKLFRNDGGEEMLFDEILVKSFLLNSFYCNVSPIHGSKLSTCKYIIRTGLCQQLSVSVEHLISELSTFIKPDSFIHFKFCLRHEKLKPTQFKT